jgi:hypothetical protein
VCAGELAFGAVYIYIYSVAASVFLFCNRLYTQKLLAAEIVNNMQKHWTDAQRTLPSGNGNIAVAGLGFLTVNDIAIAVNV